jgi:rhombotail lipoprotein
MIKCKKAGLWLLPLLFPLLFSACISQQRSTQSSVVEYLYPSDKNVVVEPTIPRLQLPLKVGVAFVPEGETRYDYISGSGALTEAKKSLLLEQVAANFRPLDYVKTIQVIPSAYLAPGGSFSNLDQIKTMYGIDVIALVSYDQVQFTDEGLLSLSYWTIVGMYAVSGEKNDTSTLVDTVVYDIGSRKMLFRAPGQSRIKGNATPINLNEELRSDSVEGFEQATAAMIFNLQHQLGEFEQRVQDADEEVQVVYSPGYSGGGGGGGSMGLAGTIMLLGLLIAVRYRKYRSRRATR